MWVKTNHFIFAVHACVTLIQLGVSQLQVHYQKMCIQADQSLTLFAQHNTFMAPIIKEIHTAKPKRLL